MNQGRRQFEEIIQTLPTVVVSGVFVGDLNDDGHLDLYLVSPQANAALVGDGTGMFVESTTELGLAGAKVVLIMSGGNLSMEKLRRILRTE